MVNKVTLIGNLGGDPEQITFEGGTTIAKTTMATSEKFKNKNGELVTNTTWHRLIFVGAIVQSVMKYLGKGSKIYVEGKIKNGSYEKNGQTIYTSEVIVRDVKFLDSKPKEDGYSQKSDGSYSVDQSHGEIDDLPF